MYKITSGQMQRVLSVIDQPMDKQKDIFESLELNPYDFYEDEEPADHYNVVIYKDVIEEQIQEIIEYTDDYFADNRREEIKNGGSLTKEERAEITTSIVESTLENDDCPQIWIIAKITDGKDYLYSLYIEQIAGQGGLHINEFLGFFPSYEEARNAVDALEIVEI